MIRWCKLLIVQFFLLIWHIGKALSSLVMGILSFLFGHFSWQAPWWLHKIVQGLRYIVSWCKKHIKITLAILATLSVFSAVGSYSYYWYNNQPKPYQVAYSITAPTLISPNLTIRFQDSVAPIGMINQLVSSGVTISEAIEGVWHWANDRTLRFKPAANWPIDRTYKVTLGEKGLLTEGALLEKYQFEFQTPRFEMINFIARLYHDPLNPEQKKIVATFNFTHPINHQDFESRVSIELSKGLKYSDNVQTRAPEFLYSKDDRQVSIHSALLETPLENSTVKVFIDKGISAQAGGNKTTQSYSTNIDVPSIYQLTLSQPKILFRENTQGETEPIFSFESSNPLTDEAIKDQVNAWLLPQRSKSSSWDLDDITAKILQQSQKVELSHIPTDKPENSKHRFKFSAPPGRQLYFQINPSLKSINGYISRNKTVFLETMPDYPKALSFLSDGALLNLNGENNLGVMARNIPCAQVEVARILPHQLHHFVNQLDYKFQPFYVSESDLDQLVERMQIDIPTNTSDPAKTYYTHVNLSPYFDRSAKRQGIFVLRLSKKKPQNKETVDTMPLHEVSDTRFIVMTDLGIIAKTTANNSHEVFVQSISTGRPIAGAQVEVYGVNGLPVVSAHTDEGGHVHFENLDSLTREKKPLMYVVSQGADLSFLPIANAGRQLDYSRFEVDGITERGQSGLLSAYLFSDRGLYRPGETAHIAMLVRSSDWSHSPEGMPVNLVVTDPRGHTVQNNQFHLSAAAFDAIDFTSGTNAPAGTYYAHLYLRNTTQAHPDHLLGSVSFSVRDFEADRIKVNLQLSETPFQGWLKPEQINAQVTAMQLFGAPAVDRRVSAQMNISPAFTVFNGYQDYRFYHAKDLHEKFSEQINETHTDENGKATLQIDLNKFRASAYQLQLLASVFEAQGGRNFTAHAQAMVSQADYLLGVKTPDRLDFIYKDALRKIHWIAIAQDLTPVAVNDLTYELVEVRYISVLVKQNDGTYRYESHRKDEVVETRPFAIAEAGLEQTLKTDYPGRFIIKIKNGELLLNQVEYTVAGNANTSRTLDRNAELQLNLNKQTYKPGEEIEVSIRAPYTGAGLITIERDKVYTHTWFLTNTTSSVQRIRIPEELEGNAYVNVQFVRSINSEEIYMSPLSYGVVPFNISLDKRRIDMDIATPKQVEPGEMIPITVQLNRPARVIVYGVDEGILQVARYKQPMPLAYFFRKRALEVNTAQILDLILPEFSILLQQSAAGGDTEGALASKLNPFKRKRKPPVVWWSGIQELPAGRSNFEWQAPDYFNGQLHFYAVAVDEQHIGITQTYTKVRAPIVLTPNVPAFITPGDIVHITTGIFNNLPQATEIKVSLQTSPGLKLQQATSVTLNIGTLREGVASFEVLAQDSLGSAELTFIAELPDGKQVRTRETISVRPAVQHRVQLDLGTFTEKSFILKPQRTLYPQLRDVQVGAGSSPMIWGTGLQAYLDNYSYPCTEQLLSKAMPALIWGSATNEQDVARFNHAIDILRQRQNSSGGFGMWNSSIQNAPTFITLYAADFLVEAQTRGFSVPQDMLDYVNRYLSQIANNASSQDLAELRDRTYAIYLLTRQGVVTGHQISGVRERLDTYFEKDQWQSDIAAAYMSATYKLLRQNKEANSLIEKQPWQSLNKTWETYGNYSDPLTHDAQYLNLLVTHFPERFNTIPTDLLVNLGIYLKQERYNSLSAALLVRALGNYDQQAQQQISVTTKAQLNNQKTQPLQMLGQPARAYVSLDTDRLILDKTDARTPAFYLLSESGYDLDMPAQPIRQGLEIIRDYLDLKGKPIGHVNVGDEFLVRIRLRTTDHNTYSNVAAVDLLPGGTEALYNQPASKEDNAENDTEKTSSTAIGQPPVGETNFSDWNPDYIDLRDDRVVLYGTLNSNVSTFTYRVRAINTGKFVTPPAFAQSMYQSTIIGQGVAGQLEIIDTQPQPPETSSAALTPPAT